jgi:hypothetical protein
MHTVSNFVNNSLKKKKKKKKKKKEKREKKSNNIKGRKTFVFFFLLDVLTFCFQFYRLGRNECRTEQVRR